MIVFHIDIGRVFFRDKTKIVTIYFSHMVELASEVEIQWFKNFFMNANVSKFQGLCVYRDINPTILELCVNVVLIRSEPHVKLLEVHIDQRLSFNYHITEMCRKLSIKQEHWLVCQDVKC